MKEIEVKLIIIIILVLMENYQECNLIKNNFLFLLWKLKNLYSKLNITVSILLENSASKKKLF